MTGVCQQSQAAGQDAPDDLGNHETGNQDEGDNQAASAGLPQFGGVIVGVTVMIMPRMVIVVVMPTVVVSGVSVVVMAGVGVVVMSRVGLVVVSGVSVVVMAGMGVVVMAGVGVVVVPGVSVVVVPGVSVVVMAGMGVMVMAGMGVVVMAGMGVVVMAFMLAVMLMGRCHVGASSIERYATAFCYRGVSLSPIEPGPGFQMAEVMVFEAFGRRFLELKRQMPDAVLFVNKPAYVR